MTNFNFLSKSSSQSCGHSSVTLASTVGSPSAHRRSTMLRLLSVLVLVLTFGVGNVWGTEEVVYTLEPANGTNNSYTGNCDVTIDGITWNLTGNSQMQPWRIGGKSITNTDRTVYSKTAMSSAITKVELTVGTASSITVNSLKLIVASDASFNTEIDEVSVTFAASSTLTFTPTSPKTEWATAAYYKFVFNVTVSESSNKFVQFTEAKFYAEATPAIPFTVTLMDDSSHPLIEEEAGDGVTLPSREGCSGYTFAGWTKSWVAEQSSWTTIAPTIIPAGSYTPTANENLYPVYTKTESGGTSFKTIAGNSITGFGSGTNYTSGSYDAGDGFTISSNSAFSTTQFRIAKSKTLTIASSNSMTEIEFQVSGTDYKLNADGITWSSTTGTYTNNSGTTSITFTNSNDNIARITQIKITYTGGTTTSYISSPNCCSPLGQINGSFYPYRFYFFIISLCQCSLLAAFKCRERHYGFLVLNCFLSYSIFPFFLLYFTRLLFRFQREIP